MKLKILTIKKEYEPFKMDNGGKIFSVFATLDIDGKEVSGMVRAFANKDGSPWAVLKAGQEFISGDTVDRIEVKDVTRNDSVYTQYTLYKKKSDAGYSGGKSKFQPYERMSFAQFVSAVNYALDVMGAHKDRPELQGVIFGSVLNNYCKHVKIIQDAAVPDKKAGPNFEDIGAPVENSEDVPF